MAPSLSKQKTPSWSLGENNANVRAQNVRHLIRRAGSLLPERVLLKLILQAKRKDDGDDDRDETAEQRKGREQAGFPAA
jgi:hypothetical protein